MDRDERLLDIVEDMYELWVAGDLNLMNARIAQLFSHWEGVVGYMRHMRAFERGLKRSQGEGDDG